MSSVLGLYFPTRKGSTWDPQKPFDSKRCPVMVTTDMGRVSRFSQCNNKPKPDVVRLVRNHLKNQDELWTVCGMHARQYDKREADSKKWAEEYARDRSDQAKAEKGAKTLKRLGIEATPSRGGKVLVDAEQVAAVLERRT
jgi:hypothetical protein